MLRSRSSLSLALPQFFENDSATHGSAHASTSTFAVIVIRVCLWIPRRSELRGERSLGSAQVFLLDTID